MKKYIKAIGQSFGNPYFYAQTVLGSTGNGLRYLWALSAVMSIVLCLKMIITVTAFMHADFKDVLHKVPTIVIENGTISSNVKQPFVLEDKNKNVVLRIDTTLDRAELQQQTGIIILGKDLIVTNSSGSVRTYEASQFKERKIVLNGPRIINIVNRLPLFALFMLPLFFIGQWLMLLSMSVMAAVLSYFVTAYMPEEYEFETRMRMSTIAVTPPLIINTALQLFTDHHLGLPITAMLWCLYFYMMVVAARNLSPGKLPILPTSIT